MGQATPIAPPVWVEQIMDEIDTLEFGPGFSHLDDASTMYFGAAVIHGVEAIKAFFVKIDEPLNVEHKVLEAWEADHTVLLRGEATMAKKTSPDEVVQAPFMHIYYLTAGTEHISTLRITAGPLQTDAVM
jgi:hypothetical protein